MRFIERCLLNEYSSIDFFKLAAASMMSLTDGSTRMLIGAVFVAMTPSSVYLFNTQFKRFLRVVNRYTLFFGDCDREKRL
ncbi:hypothetical protein AB6H14_00600 [Providencia vermicola]